jgi:hypothetical protein
VQDLGRGRGFAKDFGVIRNWREILSWAVIWSCLHTEKIPESVIQAG